MSKDITLTLSEKEHEQLCELIYMGEWMVNANKSENHNENYADIMKKVLSLSKNPSIVTHFPAFDDVELKYEKTQKLYHDFIQDYNEDNFWLHLPEKLGERDAILKAGKKKYLSLPEKEQVILHDEETGKYFDEVENHGLMRLFIKE